MESVYHRPATRALSTSAGADLLAELRRLRDVLSLVQKYKTLCDTEYPTEADGIAYRLKAREELFDHMDAVGKEAAE